jgi:multisubunit Na+/H+ antiporter MnhB subunit
MRKILSLIAIILFGVFLSFIAIDLTFGVPENTRMDDYFIQNGQEQAATNNIVTSVVFDYRGFDTLGESTVLFTAVIGVALMYRKLIRGDADENE